MVRGSEGPAPPPPAGAAPVQPPPAAGALGFRRANDAECTDTMRTFIGGVPADVRWGGGDAARCVTLVALERVDGRGARASLSERSNLLSPPAPAPPGRPCPRCTLLNGARARVCSACHQRLPRA